ncbi:MAG: hypothetical protein KGH53_01645 [Candidatus Micrarchaeota archaeon]|nr:hypothetical protein [Candidatus Micrarchaeota archaeon]
MAEAVKLVSDGSSPRPAHGKTPLRELRKEIVESAPELFNRSLRLSAIKKLREAGAFEFLRECSKEVKAAAFKELLTTALYRPEDFEIVAKCVLSKECVDAVHFWGEETAQRIMDTVTSTAMDRFGQNLSLNIELGREAETIAELLEIFRSPELRSLTEGYVEGARQHLVMYMMDGIFASKNAVAVAEKFAFLREEWFKDSLNALVQSEDAFLFLRNIMIIKNNTQDHPKLGGQMLSFLKEYTKNPHLLFEFAISFSIASTFVKEKDFNELEFEDTMRLFYDQTIRNRLEGYVGMQAKYAAECASYAAVDFKRDIGRVHRILDLVDVIGPNPEQMITSQIAATILHLNLDLIVKSHDDLRSAMIFINSGGALPKPTKENIKRYGEEVFSHLREKYSFTKEMSMEELHSISKYWEKSGKLSMQGMLKLLNEGKQESVKFYPFSQGNFTALNLGREELVRLSVISILGSRNRQEELRAVRTIGQIVEIGAINKAKLALNTKYRQTKHEIFRSSNGKPNYEQIYQTLAALGDEFVGDVLNAAEYRDIKAGRYNFVKASLSRNPLDYDGRVQTACVYLPNGKQIFNYCTDKNVMPLLYEIGAEKVGSALCYISGRTLIVDSVEGHRVVREKKEMFAIIYDDIVERSKELGVDRVIFSKAGINLTAKEFAQHVESKGLPTMKVGVNLRALAKGFETRKRTEGYYLDLVKSPEMVGALAAAKQA